MNNVQLSAYSETIASVMTLTTSSSEMCRPPSQLELLVWSRYVTFIRHTIVHHVELSNIAHFLPLACETNATEGSSFSSARGLSFFHSEHRQQLQKWGHVPLAEHHQRSMRWSLLLRRWVQHRLAHGASLMEAGLYRDCFLPTAAEILPPFCLEPVATAIAELATQSIPRELDAAAAGVPLPYVEAFTRCTAALCKDCLQVTWDFVNPKTMTAAVSRRLPKLLLAQNEDTANKEDANNINAPHSATLQPLLFLWDAGRPHPIPMQVVPTFIQLLERVGYDMLTKMNSGFIDRCYYVLPFMMDMEEAVEYVKSILPVSLLQEASPRLGALLHVLRIAVDGLYTQEVRTTLSGYKKVLSRDKLQVHIGDTDGLITLSSTAMRLLSYIVEPSYCILRYPRRPESPSARYAVQTKGTIIAIIQREWQSVCAAEDILSRRNTATRAQQDFQWLVSYMEAAM